MDASGLDVCVGNRRGDLFDALQVLNPKSEFQNPKFRGLAVKTI